MVGAARRCRPRYSVAGVSRIARQVSWAGGRRTDYLDCGGAAPDPTLRGSTMVREPWPSRRGVESCGPDRRAPHRSGGKGPRRSYAAMTAAWTGGGKPAMPRSQARVHLTGEVPPDRVDGRRRIEVAVVEAVGQQHHVGREPVAADVAALPDLVRPLLGQRGGHRSAADGAAGVVYAVGADQDHGSVLDGRSGLGAGRSSASTAAPRSRSSAHGPYRCSRPGRSASSGGRPLRVARPADGPAGCGPPARAAACISARQHRRVDA